VRGGYPPEASVHVEKDRQSNRKKKMGDEELACEEKSGAC